MFAGGVRLQLTPAPDAKRSKETPAILLGQPEAAQLVAALRRRGMLAEARQADESDEPGVLAVVVLDDARVELRRGSSTVHCTDFDTALMVHEALREQLSVL